MAYDRDRYDRERREHDRGAFDRAGDEVRSWFGDDEARRRRERDERYSERGYNADRPPGDRDYGPDRPYADRDYRPIEREGRWRTEPPAREEYRDYSDRYGRTYRSPIDRPVSTGSQEFGPEGYGSVGSYGWSRGYGREWRGTETWRVPGPYAGRGPKGYQRSDERIREELSDRLTAHGHIDATDVEVRVQGGEVTLVGFVDNRETKRAAEDLAEDVHGVREVHNQLRVRSHADDTGAGRTSVLGLTERETQTADTARSLDARDRQADAAARSRARNP